MFKRRSKPYVAVLLGGYPSSVDKVMEFVADRKTHLSFIWGFNVFVIYFNSRERLTNIRKMFLTTMRKEVEMIFVFEDGDKSVQYVSSHIKEQVRSAEKDRQNVIGGDLAALREIMFLLAARYNMAHPISSPYEGDANIDEDLLTDDDRLNQLLDKMKKSGYESLTPAELDFLREYKEKKNKDNQNQEPNVDQ